MVFTRLAVLLATSLADWTNWRLATGLAVREEARRHVLHRAEVCFATMVAADSTCREEQGEVGSTISSHPHSSPFPQTPRWAPVTAGFPLGTQESSPRSCTTHTIPQLDCYYRTKAVSWCPVWLMRPDEILAITLASSWDTALLTSLIPFVQKNGRNSAPPHTHLGLGTGRVHQVLAGHLDGLVGSGKLSGVYQALLSSLAVGV